MSGLSFKKNFTWTFAGQLSNILSQFTIIIVLSKLSSVENVGTYGIITAIISPIQLFLMMDLGKLMITEKFLNEKFPFYHGLIIMCSLLIPFISFLLSLFFFEDKLVIPAVIAISLLRAIMNYRDFCYSLYQYSERMDYMGKSLMITSIGTIVLFTTIYYFTLNMALSFGSVAIFYLITLFFYDFIRIKQVLNLDSIRASFSLYKSRSIIRKGISLGLTASVTSFKSNIPRYFIEIILQDRAMLGYYTAFMQLVTPLGYFNQTLAKVSIGKLNSLFNKNFHLFKLFFIKLIGVVISLGLIILLGAYLLGEFISSIIFEDDYAAFNFILVFLIASRIFVLPLTYFKMVQLIIDQIDVQLFVMIFSCVFLLVFSLLMVDWFGIKGILTSLLITEALTLIITIFLVIKKLKKSNLTLFE